MKLFNKYRTNRTLALETLASDGEMMICADGKERHCFPILCGIIADYQEQTLITGVKCNVHCTICKVPPNERENLTGGPWEIRTHEDTKAQIAKQRANKVDKSSDDWVHNMDCFAWSHRFFNVHEGMLVDTLHQLLKGLVMYLVKWIQRLVGDLIPKKRKRKGTTGDTSATGGKSQLDDRFKNVPEYAGLRLFSRTAFSKVSQWTGDEQKAIVRQLVAVVTPLLIDREPYALHFTKAVCDFVTIAQYRTHDDETLDYLHDALKRIDSLKHVFHAFRPKKKDEPLVGHFNLPKMHVLTHWASSIRQRGAPDGYDTGPNGESPHCFLVKSMYKLTNRRDSLLQIGNLNSRLISVYAAESHFLMNSSSTTTQAIRDLDLQITSPSNPIRIVKLGWEPEELSSEEKVARKRSGFSSGYWASAAYIQEKCAIPGLLYIVSRFIQEQRQRSTYIAGHTHLQDRLSSNVMTLDGSWSRRVLMRIHPSIQCWRREGKDTTDTEILTRQLVRCRPWCGGADWRRDYAIALEGETGRDTDWDPDDEHNRLYMKSIGQIELIVSIADLDRRTADHTPAIYTGVIIRRLQPLNDGMPHPVHGMLEFCDPKKPPLEASGQLGSCKIFPMHMVSRGVHIVPDNSTPPTKYFLNNYIDFDLYNRFYSPTFRTDGEKVIREYKRYRRINKK